ncbi:MarR family transcriptional regulator [Vibrio sp.]|nr:MarR family transcriptional regulator [Vibrio sp.]
MNKTSNSDNTCLNESDVPLTLESQVCFPLYSAANAIVRAYRPILEKIDLTYLQYLVMMVLWEESGISVKTLGDKLHLDSGTLTPLLKRLESKALVERKRSVTDERVRVLQLTKEGIELRKQAQSVPGSIACRFNLSLDELLTLKMLCEKILAQ